MYDARVKQRGLWQVQGPRSDKAMKPTVSYRPYTKPRGLWPSDLWTPDIRPPDLQGYKGHVHEAITTRSIKTRFTSLLLLDPQG